MKKTMLVVMLAAVAGFSLASAPAFGVLRYNVWEEYGAQFQLGYVIGYLDAVSLFQRKDVRASIPTSNTKLFDRWVSEVNAFYAQPGNRDRPVADAMFEVGKLLQTEMLKAMRERVPQKGPLPSPSPQS